MELTRIRKVRNFAAAQDLTRSWGYGREELTDRGLKIEDFIGAYVETNQTTEVPRYAIRTYWEEVEVRFPIHTIHNGPNVEIEKIGAYKAQDGSHWIDEAIFD